MMGGTGQAESLPVVKHAGNDRLGIRLALDFGPVTVIYFYVVTWILLRYWSTRE